jgi:nucleotide-binding universal stress UspA family protein
MTLDGTELSEEALSMVPLLSTIGMSSLRLIGVWEELDGFIGDAKREREANERGQALLDAYLKSKSAGLQSASLKVETIVRIGRAAEQILLEADETKPDVIVIATHGRTGAERWRLGSVADKVIRGASCPTLVIGPNVILPSDGYAVSRIVVPLDGSELAEEALTVADWLAITTGASLELVEVAHLPATWTADPMYMPDVVQILEALDEAARSYLAQKVPQAPTKRTVIKSAMPGSVAIELLDYLHGDPPDLVVMTSHARHGLSRSMLGSVADELLRGSSPVLLIRPGLDEHSRLIEMARGMIEPDAPAS